jgi:hypothetical protein
MSTDTDWITSYLDREASRVAVADTLDDVLGGTPVISLTATRVRARRRSSSIVLAAAAVAGVAIVGAVLTAPRPQTVAVDAAAAPPPATEPATTPPPTASPTTLPALAYPDGGMMLGGQRPLCTALDATSYSCTLPEPFPGDVPNYDDTGYAEFYTDDTGVVTGGCRSTSADASAWICYVGERAVEQQIIGDGFLGEVAGTGFSPG